MEKKISQMDVAIMCVNLAYERVKQSWPAVLVKLKYNFGPDFKVFDEGYALLDMSLLLIAWEICYIRRNYPKGQAEPIEQAILGIIEMQDNGAYSLAEVNDYMQLYDKDMTLSSKILLQLIRDEKKFIAYKFSDIDFRKTLEIFRPLIGVASTINKSYKIKNDIRQDIPVQDSVTKKNERFWRKDWMKNWKVPAVALPLLLLGGYLLFNGNLDSPINDVIGILAIFWMAVIPVTVIWLLLVFPWKGMKNKLRSSEKIKNWKLPGVILVLLIVAMVFRWGSLGSRTVDSNTDKYKVDHWTGEIYKDSFTSSGFQETIEYRASFDSEPLTEIWKYALGTDVIWLLYAVSNLKRKDDKDNIYQGG